MSSSRKNILAYALLFAAAMLIFFGVVLLGESSNNNQTQATTATSQIYDTTTTIAEPESTTYQEQVFVNSSAFPRTLAGVLMLFAAAAAAAFGIFVFRQEKTVFGPDGAVLLMVIIFGILLWFSDLRESRFFMFYALRIAEAAGLFAALIFLREIYGWIRAKLSLSWCLIARLSKRAGSLGILVYFFFIIAPLAAFAVLLISAGYRWNGFYFFIPLEVFIFLLFAFAAVCLVKHMLDMKHFRLQLESFEDGGDISVRKGDFEDAERRLLEIKKQNEEAVKEAVVSERFKVELISNVSHDLRTPLTSILGYGQLLKGEELSEEGSAQLERLNRKADYMNELVEALFELTKVSSGALECKKEELDLVSLLEQTVGLLDDEISFAGLEVKRYYAEDKMPVVTDGGRMHQVFANLLGNAVKYSLKGTRIYIRAESPEDRYSVRIVNTASYEMDFTPEEIMQRFARGDKARSTKGSGLGLAIAQTYTESVGGEFKVIIDGDQFSAVVTLPKS